MKLQDWLYLGHDPLAIFTNYESMREKLKLFNHIVPNCYEDLDPLKKKRTVYALKIWKK